MNRLSTERRARILRMLVEGMSMRSTARTAGVSINIVVKLLRDTGNLCKQLHNDIVKDVKPKHVECDEIWSYCYAKKKNVEKAKAAPPGAGDVWTWIALDADTKLIISWLVGGRGKVAAVEFVRDLFYRMNEIHKGSVRISTDGHPAYVRAFLASFTAIDAVRARFGQVVKTYEKREIRNPAK